MNGRAAPAILDHLSALADTILEVTLEEAARDLGSRTSDRPNQLGTPDGGNDAHADRLTAAISGASALLVVTPACGAGLSPELANAVEWTSHPRVRERLAGKPVAIMGATSTSEDTEACELQVSDALRFRDANVVSGPDVRVSGADSRTDERGRLTGQHIRSSVRELLDRLGEQAQAV